MAQAIEHLPSKLKALNSNPSTANKLKNEKLNGLQLVSYDQAVDRRCYGLKASSKFTDWTLSPRKVQQC
jgi:hypothetical protein